MNADNMLYHPDFRAFEKFSNDDTGVGAFRTFRKTRKGNYSNNRIIIRYSR
jgi:primosomal protein N'